MASHSADEIAQFFAPAPEGASTWAKGEQAIAIAVTEASVSVKSTLMSSLLLFQVAE
jgi:hypothetical protein